jgi:hypothetical protein
MPQLGQQTAGAPTSIRCRHRPQNAGRSELGNVSTVASVSLEKY